MLVYKASYVYLDDGVHGEVVDFPGVISSGNTINETRRLLAGALEDMAETNILMGDPLPVPNPEATNPDADLEEPIHLILNAGTRVKISPVAVA